MDITDPTPGDVTAGQTLETSTSAADPGTSHQSAPSSSDNGNTEANDTQSLTDELLGREEKPQADQPATATETDAERKTPAQEQPDDEREPTEEELAKMSPPQRGRIKNLLKKNRLTAAERDEVAKAKEQIQAERDQLAAAFANIDKHLEGIKPEEINDVLRELGAAKRGDQEAKNAIRKRLGLDPEATADKATAPAAPKLPEDIETELAKLTEYGFEDQADALRKAWNKNNPVRQAEPSKPAETTQEQPAPRTPAAPQEDPSFTAGVSEMKAIVEGVKHQVGAQAPVVIDAIGKRFVAEMQAEKQRTGVEPPPSQYGRFMAKARDAVLSLVQGNAQPATAQTRSNSQPHKHLPSVTPLTDELIGR